MLRCVTFSLERSLFVMQQSWVWRCSAEELLECLWLHQSTISVKMCCSRDEMSERGFTFAGDNSLWTLAWRLLDCYYLLHFKRPECTLIVSGRHSSSVGKFEEGKARTSHASSVVLVFAVPGQVSQSGRGHRHPCKNDCGFNHFQANTLVNILWFYFALFVLVFCDNQATAKQLSIIHICSTGSSTFSRTVDWRDT